MGGSDSAAQYCTEDVDLLAGSADERAEAGVEGGVTRGSAEIDRRILDEDMRIGEIQAPAARCICMSRRH